MKVGFTGTKQGLSREQLAQLTLFFAHTKAEITEFHHGDCVGADAQSHDLAKAYGVFVVTHPPIKTSARAFKQGDARRPPKDYLVRDRDIVAECDMLIACPLTDTEKVRSGTWYTVRRAREKRMPIWLITPDGNAGFEG